MAFFQDNLGMLAPER